MCSLELCQNTLLAGGRDREIFFTFKVFVFVFLTDGAFAQPQIVLLAGDILVFVKQSICDNLKDTIFEMLKDSICDILKGTICET